MATQGAYSVRLSDDALLQMRALDKPVRERITKRLAQLAVLPLTRTLIGFADRRVLEIGSYRALYFVDEKNRMKIVAWVGDHKSYERECRLLFRSG